MGDWMRCQRQYRVGETFPKNGTKARGSEHHRVIQAVKFYRQRLIQLVTNRCTKSVKCPQTSFRRKPESRNPARDWTPAFAGVTEVEFDHLILWNCT